MIFWQDPLDSSTVYILFYELTTPKWLKETPNVEVDEETPDDEAMDTSESDNNRTFNIYWQYWWIHVNELTLQQCHNF